MSDLAQVVLKKNCDRRIRAGHLWVFSNEIDVELSPLAAFEAGQLVRVNTSSGQFVGYGYINPASLICVRLLSRDQKHVPDTSLLVHRIKVALGLRQRLFDKPFYRLIYGESDFLPGMAVDRFGDHLAVQLTTAGAEKLGEQFIEALIKVIKPVSIVLRNDSASRQREGLESFIRVVEGEAPEYYQIEDAGVKYQVPSSGGQKTGWFYDQRPNREWLEKLVTDCRVLDVFSYVGAWGIKAAVAGANQVMCVDSSADALDRVEENARLNNVEDRLVTLQGDAFQALKALREEREKFDVVIIDPPAFIKRRKDYKSGLEAYNRLNRLAMQMLGREGMLVSCSCSFHMPRAELQKAMLTAARHHDRHMQILYQGYQGADHPVHPAIPETEYLKSIFARILLA